MDGPLTEHMPVDLLSRVRQARVSAEATVGPTMMEARQQYLTQEEARKQHIAQQVN